MFYVTFCVLVEKQKTNKYIQHKSCQKHYSPLNNNHSFVTFLCRKVRGQAEYLPPGICIPVNNEGQTLRCPKYWKNCSKKDNVLCSYDIDQTLCNKPVLGSQAVLKLFWGWGTNMKNAASNVFCADTEKQVCFHEEWVLQLLPSADSIYVQLWNTLHWVSQVWLIHLCLGCCGCNYQLPRNHKKA